MAITVREGLMDILRSGASATARLQVISGEDIGVVALAVRAAVPEIESLAPADVPAIVMGPYLIPGSCLLLVDFEAATQPATTPGRQPGGRIELTIGEPEQWVPGHPGHDAVRQQARRVLPPPY